MDAVGEWENGGARAGMDAKSLTAIKGKELSDY